MAQKFTQKIDIPAENVLSAMQKKTAIEKILENISSENIFMLAAASERPDINQLLEAAKDFLK